MVDVPAEIEDHTWPLWPSVTAIGISLVGLADSVYLTIKHFDDEIVPCSLIEGCEVVLSSSYAEFAGIPLAALGVAAYFAAFSFALLTLFGMRGAWRAFGALAGAMAVFSLWLIYLQAYVIGAFCQFCLVSAASSLTLFVIFVASRFFISNPARPETDNP